MKALSILMAAAMAAGLAAAGTAAAQSKDGHWTDAGSTIWKDGSGMCWKAGYWTPAMAIEECDPDLVSKPGRPAPAPAPAAKPAPQAKTLTITSTQLFAFNKSDLSSEAKARLDREVLGRLDEFATVQFVNVYGHTDRLGSAQYNQKLSERRANAVKAYLVSKGLAASKVETYGYGKTSPVKSCPGTMSRKAVIDCLAPNRRVVVEAKGMPK
ncbi:MAG: OmpA family protein [Burkholderiales bacterium]|nr:OmpA family protein [Burkholderiales bacterium]